MDMPETPTRQGLYPLPEAARLARLDTRAARRWAEGYDYVRHGEKRRSAGIVGLSLAPIGRHVDLTFPEMLTLRLVKGFRDTGLGLRTIRRVAEAAARDWGTPTPFASRRFRTDGRKVFLELGRAEPANDEPAVPRDERELIDMLSGQREFADVVEPSLFARVEWLDEAAARWWPMGLDRAVVLDPLVMFGAPRVRGTRLPTAALAAAVRAEGGGGEAVRAVAEWHGVPADSIRDAVDFETEWLRQAA